MAHRQYPLYAPRKAVGRPFLGLVGGKIQVGNDATMMDQPNQTMDLCIQGTQAEFAGRFDQACALYWQAWLAASSDYEASIAAHYVARCQPDPQEKLRWNKEAVKRADEAHDERVAAFYPSLYLNLGQSFEQLGDLAQAQHFYELARQLGLPHDPGYPG